MTKYWIPNTWSGYAVFIVSGHGIGQMQPIEGNDYNTLTINGTWLTVPDVNSDYIILQIATTPQSVTAAEPIQTAFIIGTVAPYTVGSDVNYVDPFFLTAYQITGIPTYVGILPYYSAVEQFYAYGRRTFYAYSTLNQAVHVHFIGSADAQLAGGILVNGVGLTGGLGQPPDVTIPASLGGNMLLATLTNLHAEIQVEIVAVGAAPTTGVLVVWVSEG
jgi:hypothetical protein